MKKLFTLFTLLVMAVSGAWAQTVTWTASNSATYTQGQELSSNTSIISVKLGTGSDWAYWINSKTQAGVSTKKAVVLTNNIPTDGMYIVIKPAVDINFTLQSYTSNAHNLILVEESAPTVQIKNYRQRYTVTNDMGTLSAGKTYYIYTSYVESGFLSFKASTYVNYTINYVDAEGTELKTPRNASGLYGEIVTATAEDLDYITFNGNKYKYSSGNANITLGNTNEINLVFEKIEVDPCNYSVNAVCGTTMLQQFTSGTGFEGDTYGVTGLPYVIEKDGNFYVLDDNQATNFSKSFVMGTEDVVSEVNYTLDNNIVGFSEVGTGDNAAYSGGGFAYVSTKLASATVASGIYRAEIKVVSNGSGGKNHRYEGVYVGSTMVATTDNSDKLFTFDFPVINDNTEIFVQGRGSGNNTDNLDYVLIRRIADMFPLIPNADATCVVTNPNIAGNSNGWTCEKYNGGNGPLQSATGNNNFEYWAGNATNRDEAGFDYYQTIIGLPNGLYTVSADMNNSLNSEQGAVFNESCGVYGVSGESSAMAYVTVEGGDRNRYTTAPILVENNTLRIGVKSDKRMGARWFVADDFVLTYVSPATVNVTLKDETYYTYVTPYAMNFEGTRVNAYKVTPDLEKNAVILDPVTEVPANTALVIQGETGNVPVIASAEDINSALTYSAEDVTATAADLVTYYYLGTENGKDVFRPLAVGGTIKAGKCYFEIAKGGSSKPLRIVTDGENATDAGVVEAAPAVVKNGKYTENGQIVIFINGKKYNVAGMNK